MSPPEHHDPETLAEIEARIWHELVRAAVDRSHAWRTAVLATVDAQGEADARSVVIREVDASRRELVFFADARSPKITQFKTRPQGTMVMWSPELGWQLRLRLTLRVNTSGLVVSSRWARLKMTPAAYDYLSPLPPGSPVAHPAPVRGTREHFAVVTAQVQALDWLCLRSTGQRRALFSTQAPPSWLQP